MQAHKSSGIFGKSINYAHAKPRPGINPHWSFKKTTVREVRAFIKFKDNDLCKL